MTYADSAIPRSQSSGRSPGWSRQASRPFSRFNKFTVTLLHRNINFSYSCKVRNCSIIAVGMAGTPSAGRSRSRGAGANNAKSSKGTEGAKIVAKAKASSRSKSPAAKATRKKSPAWSPSPSPKPASRRPRSASPKARRPWTIEALRVESSPRDPITAHSAAHMPRDRAA